MERNKKNFGTTKAGEQVIEYTLFNEHISLSFLNYGGVITTVITPDKNGVKENINSAFDNIKQYEEKSPYFGAIVGRNAGRIAYGQFTINNQEYQLEINNGDNNLHGGSTCMSHKIWDVKEIKNGYQLSYLSPDKEYGFPGEVNVKVDYLLENKTFTIKYHATASEDTFMNFTNHSYFNLSGGFKTNILNHQLTVDSDSIAELNSNLIPDGTKMSVTDTPFDFRKEKEIGKEINEPHQQLEYGNGYDHPWYLNHKKDYDVILRDTLSGRTLTINTDQKCVVIYTGNFLGEEGLLTDGVNSEKNIAIALETQNVPNYMNIKKDNTKLYSPTNDYTAYVKWTFGIEK